MFSIIHNYFNQSIRRLVMASFVFVLLLPLGFLASSLPEESWGSVKKEVLEKHLLVAKSVEESINLYFSSYQKSLQVFANTADITSIKDFDEFQEKLDYFVRNLDGVVAASYLSLDDYSRITAVRNMYKVSMILSPGEDLPFLKYLTFGNRHNNVPAISAVFKSNISNRPAVLLKTYIYDKRNSRRGILFTEVGLSYVNDICTNVTSGGKEHCVVVDSLGQVVAHPNQEWVNSIKNLSKISVVQKIQNKQSGTTSFHAPFIDQESVAGYATIKNTGWGVIIAQPKDDLESPMEKVMQTIFIWLVVGVLLALIVAYMLTLQITKPINSLVIKSQEADIRSDTFNLGAIPKNSPLEICKLWSAISSLVSRLQATNKEVRKLNNSLSRDIANATEKLRATNKYLYKISSSDHLTQIANRRFFEDNVNKILKSKMGERASIILIDVDKFKFINDEYGHEAGDLALKHIANLMKECTRDGDLPARLGGDEFIIFIRNCNASVLTKIAENLRKKVNENPIVWGDQQVDLSLSIGTVNYEIDGKIELDKLIKYADEAMYVSKESGRNNVSAYSFKSVSSASSESSLKLNKKPESNNSQPSIQLLEEPL